MVSGSGTHAAAEFLHKDLPYRSSDFEQIGLVNISPMVLVARSGVPANTLKEFVAYLHANEKNVTEADAGVRGTPQATMDLVAGNVDFGCNQIVNIAPHIKTGKLKAYAVTSNTRSPMLPDVPTTGEAGLPQFNLTVWFGLSAPKGTPRPIVETLNKALNIALQDPDVVKRFADLGYDVAPIISTNFTRTRSRCGRRCLAVSAWAISNRRHERNLEA